jgi:hypothetical protein
MNPPTSLQQAIQDVSEAKPRAVRGFGKTFWKFSIPGSEAVAAWQSLRDRAYETQHWPLIVSGYQGPDLGGSEGTIRRLAESARSIAKSSDKELEFARMQRTPAKTLKVAATISFETWGEQRRNPQFMAQESLRKAAYYDTLPGAERMAALWRESAEQWANWREEKPNQPPAKAKRYKVLPQYELHSVQRFDMDALGGIINETVSLLLVPTPMSWEIPAWLLFDPAAGERPSALHVAALKWLLEKYGAELIGIDHRGLEVVPHQKPATKEQAAKTARLLSSYAHCPFTSESENPPEGDWVPYLMDSTYWSFCWP